MEEDTNIALMSLENLYRLYLALEIDNPKIKKLKEKIIWGKNKYNQQLIPIHFLFNTKIIGIKPKRGHLRLPSIGWVTFANYHQEQDERRVLLLQAIKACDEKDIITAIGMTK